MTALSTQHSFNGMKPGGLAPNPVRPLYTGMNTGTPVGQQPQPQQPAQQQPQPYQPHPQAPAQAAPPPQPYQAAPQQHGTFTGGQGVAAAQPQPPSPVGQFATKMSAAQSQQPQQGGVASAAQQAPQQPQQVAGTGMFSPLGAQPQINATSVYTPDQQNQLMNQAFGQNARAEGTANQQVMNHMGGAGFAGGGSPAAMAMQNKNAASRMGADEQARVGIPLQVAQANANQMLQGQQAQEGQYNNRANNMLQNQGQQYGFLGNLFNSLLV